MLDKHLLKQFSLPTHWRLEDKQDSLYLYTGEGRPFTLDFAKFKNLSKIQPLAKAIGCKSYKKIKVLDLTAGWGKDAFLLAGLSYKVTAIESNPIVFAFLNRALNKHVKAMPSLKFVLDDSLNYLKNIKQEERPDVIYIDPMFGDVKKSLSTKPLRILKQLAGETTSIEILFRASINKALDCIVVKRYKHHKSLSIGALMSTFSGRSVCYDVFAPHILKGEP